MTFAQSRLFVLKALSKRGLDDFELTECSFALVSTPIIARTRKLRAVWTVEEDQTLEAIQQLEVCVEPGVEERLKEILDNMAP